MTTPSTTTPHPKEEGKTTPRSVEIYRRVDRTVFAFEAGIVTLATALMTVFVFLNIVFDFSNNQRLRITTHWQNGTLFEWSSWFFSFTSTGEAAPDQGGLVFGDLFPSVVAFCFLFSICLAISGRLPALKDRTGLHIFLGASALMSAIGVYLWFMLSFHPKWSCFILSLLVMGYSAYSILKSRPRQTGYLWISWLVVAFGLIAFSASVSDRFSAWTSRYALFLLLWTGFIGASMATSRGGHLRIDAVRKTLPEHMISRYNTLSFLVAALSSAVFCWLSFIYTLRRFGADTTEGEIPDWIKVLAIPVSMFFIALRFSGRAWLSAIGQPDVPPDNEQQGTIEVSR